MIELIYNIGLLILNAIFHGLIAFSVGYVIMSLCFEFGYNKFATLIVTLFMVVLSSFYVRFNHLIWKK